MRVDSFSCNYRNNGNLADYTPRANNDGSIFASSSGNANGKIDEPFSQGNIGDCALLSSVYSLSLTEDGAKAINDAIKIKKAPNGNTEGYEVYFTGIDKTYTVTPEELEKAKEFHGDNKTERVYSRGDDDMTILELAMEKCFNDSDDPTLRDLVDNYSSSNLEDKLNGVNPSSVSYLLTGKIADTVIKPNSELRKTFIPCATYSIYDRDGKELCLEEGGKYTAKGLSRDKSYIYFENPNDKNNDIIVPTNSFIQDIYIPNIEEASQKTYQLMEDFEENNDNSMLVFATMNPETVTDVDGNKLELIGPHAYGVSDIEDDVVTLVNPHDSSEPIKIPEENLLSLDRFYLYGLDFGEEEFNQ